MTLQPKSSTLVQSVVTREEAVTCLLSVQFDSNIASCSRLSSFLADGGFVINEVLLFLLTTVGYFVTSSDFSCECSTQKTTRL